MRRDQRAATRSCRPHIVALGRTPHGHPEGLREAFANLYGEVAQERMARSLGEPVPPVLYPRIEEAAHTMAFIEACLRSQASGHWEPWRHCPADVRAVSRPTPCAA